MAGKDAPVHEARDRLEPLDRMHGPRRVPDDAGRDLLVDGFLPVAAVARQDHRPRLGQLDEERLMPRGVPVAPEHGDAGHDLGVAVEEPPPVARQVEVLLVVEAGEEPRGVARVRVLVLLGHQLGLREEKGAARVIEVQVGEDHHVDVLRLDPHGVQAVHEQVGLGEGRQGVASHEAGHGARREAGVEENGRVRGPDEIAGDGDAHPLPRALAEEEPALLEAHEAVLQRVERLNGHVIWRLCGRPGGARACAGAPAPADRRPRSCAMRRGPW